MEQDKIARAAMVPADLLLDIFSKLPVKSLIRFKSLSKTLNSLIGNPSFISKHLTSQTESVSLFQRTNPYPKKSDLGLYSLLYSSHQLVQGQVSWKLDDQVDGLAYQHVWDCKVPAVEELSTIACCRGLVCLASKEKNRTTRRLFLCNPATRATKLIYEAPDTTRPVREYDELRWQNHNHIHYGFAYDGRADDCKLARLSKSGRFQLYSVNTSTWGSVRDVGFRPGCLIQCCSMVSVNGHLYWLLIIPSSPSEFAIQSYNLSDDHVQEIAVPEECRGGTCGRITELDGNLCLVVAYSQPGDAFLSQRKEVDLWVMKEIEGTDQVSWIKSFTVSPPLKLVDQVITWKRFIVYSYFRRMKLCFSIVGSLEPYRFITCSQGNQHLRSRTPYYLTNALLLYRQTLLPV